MIDKRAITIDFSSLVDVNIRSRNDGLDNSLAVGALAVASSFERISCLTKGEAIEVVSTRNIALKSSEHTGVTRVA